MFGFFSRKKSVGECRYLLRLAQEELRHLRSKHDISSEHFAKEEDAEERVKRAERDLREAEWREAHGDDDD